MNPVMPQIKTVVVLTLENRSLDNLLGFLYGPGSKFTPYPPESSGNYAGVPADAHNSYHSKSYSPTNGTHSSLFANALTQPNFDPHEEFEHACMQMYADGNGNMPPGNFWATTPPMTGFAWDYSNFANDNQSVMGSYSADQLPAMHGLARSFAVSDRWFSSVPTQTFANRAYQLLGTSLGTVDNSEIMGNNVAGLFSLDQRCVLFKNTKSLFNALSAAGKSWGFYWENDGGPAAGSPPGVPFTQWLCPQMDQAANGGLYKVSGTPDSFMNQLAAGTLPNFCFLEPKWGGGIVGNTFTSVQGTDYHPPASVAPAEWYLNEIYNAIIASPQWNEMLFIVTFDEHGGTYDHLPPPTTVAPDAVRGKSEFTFERLGVRVPTLLISPYVPAGVVFRSPVAGADFDHTSFIATLLKWAGVDPASAGMGNRVAVAPTFEGVISATARTDKPKFAVPESYANQAVNIGVPGGDFKGTCGENSFAASQYGLELNTPMCINGNTDLNSCVRANDGGCVYGITVTGSPGIYDYVVNVDAQGPKGWKSGSMYLAFTDQTGDTYKLSIYSSTRSVHTVRYNSKAPLIIKFRWSNTSI